MKLESVRELKAQLASKQIKPFIASPKKVAVMAMSARAVADIDPIQRSIALGIAQHGTNDYKLAVRIQARSFESSPVLETIVKHAKGEADVRYIGRITKSARTGLAVASAAGPNLHARQRPLIIGCSIGHFRITAGTLGCFVQTTKTSSPHVLSNNHVLADENRGKIGDPIIQPGAYDGGSKGKDTIGRLTKFVRLKKTGANPVDCAIAHIKQSVGHDSSNLAGLGILRGVADSPIDVGLRVGKVGRTTGTTSGRITAFELDNVIVGYDLGNIRFDDQIEIEGAGAGPFSQGGDSGSLIVDQQGLAVALLFAGGDQGGTNGQGLTYGNPIKTVFEALGVKLLLS